MNAKLRILITALVAMTMVLSACAPGETPDPAQVKNAASTMVAQTAQASAARPTGTPNWGETTKNEPPTATNAPALVPAASEEYQGAEGCVDGKIVSNQYADINRIPIGTLEGAIVAEVSWTGSGFGGFDRAVVVIPRMTSETMAFVRNSKTIHLVQYCGNLDAILAWAPTHVDAMVQSAQDDQGNRPDSKEVGVYFLNLNGEWSVVREGPLGPGLEFVKQRIVMTP